MIKNKHLDIDSRIIIEKELDKNNTFKGIARLLEKDCTTISKEIRSRITYVKCGSYGKSFNDCLSAFLHKCSAHHTCPMCTSMYNRQCWSCGKCMDYCPTYEKYTCPKLTKPPYVCNGCKDYKKCSLEKHIYKAAIAQQKYEELRHESRSGIALNEIELQLLDDKLSPLLKKGQSLHHIVIHHADELMKSERTLYKYVNNGLFSARNIDMPRTVRMRPRKNVSKHLKVDKSCRIGRDFKTFKQYLKSHPYVPVRQLDSVEGIKGGAVLLTIHFKEQALQLAFLRKSNDSQSVIDIFNKLYFELNPDVFMDIFPIVLADNGSEFSNPTAIEFDQQGNQRTNMFYCDPNASYQKPNCENNHELIRRIIPRGIDIGKYTQKDIDLMMSYINSYSRLNLGNKSPYELFEFQYGTKILQKFNLKKIPADEINITPSLLNNRNSR